jgi:hypothetical protein
MYASIDEWQKSTGSSKKLLHLGCGSKYWQGWCNIDGYPPEDTDTHRGTLGTEMAPDLWSDIRTIPVDDGMVDGIASHHVLEHFYKHQVEELASYFYQLLKPGGFLVTEMPDLMRIIFLLSWLPVKPRYSKSMNANRDIILSQLYGASWEANDKGYPYHKYVWQRGEFCAMLRKVGYHIVLETGATLSHVPFRDMAIIAQKPMLLEQKENIKDASDIMVVLNQYGNKQARTVKQLKSIFGMLKRGLL